MSNNMNSSKDKHANANHEMFFVEPDSNDGPRMMSMELVNWMASGEPGKPHIEKFGVDQETGAVLGSSTPEKSRFVSAIVRLCGQTSDDATELKCRQFLDEISIENKGLQAVLGRFARPCGTDLTVMVMDHYGGWAGCPRRQYFMGKGAISIDRELGGMEGSYKAILTKIFASGMVSYMSKEDYVRALHRELAIH